MKIKDLKEAIANLHDDAEIVVNYNGTECKRAGVLGEMMISPAGTKFTMTSWALVLEVEPRGQILTLDGSKLVFKDE